MTQLLLVIPVVPSVSHNYNVHKLWHWHSSIIQVNIVDLFKAKVFLKSVVDWQSLGLALGLLYPTLKRIKKEQHGDISDCMMEMIAAWLQQQDNVSQNPSWSVLRTALRSIGENELASSSEI